MAMEWGKIFTLFCHTHVFKMGGVDKGGMVCYSV
ncbi:hypothetical protein SDC9_64822 [bioreactor metagenome]|uniref:Uncharacterized protein n=1 Tax=bioreactor metagenome TaxID=1076179 RepID=A0A644XRL0_9ZZZZ